MKNVTIIRNIFDPESAEHFGDVESVCATLEDQFDAWPATARIYDGAVAKERDVTPRCDEDIEALENLGSGEAIVVVHPAGPILIIAAVVAVAAVAALLLIPSIPAVGNRQSQSPNNQLSDRQNRSRVKARIPDIFGQFRSTPDLIASPYSIFIGNQEIEVAYMCVGRGEFDIPADEVRDDSTQLSTIDGASAEFYGPGTSPNSGTPFLSIGTAINRPVLTSKRITSVNGQVLEGASSGSGAWVGPFTINLRKMDRVSINIVALQGMYKDDGDQQSASVSYQVEVQPIDDAGQPIGSPITATGTVNGSASDRDQKASTTTVSLSAERSRVEVRVRRTTALDNVFEGQVVDEIKWRDCYGQAAVSKTDFGDITTVQTQTYATEGALALKARKFNCLVTRKLPSRDGVYGFTTALTATRNAADIICAMALDPLIGRMAGGNIIENGGSGQVDVPQIFSEIADVVSHFGIDEAGFFDYTFDRADLSFDEMVQIAARTVFCEAFRRGSTLKLFFEKPRDDSALLFNHANKVPGQDTRTYTFGTPEGNDGVALAYIDPVDDASVTFYAPQGDDSALNAVEIDGLGIRSFEQAYLHAWRRWNKIQYRRFAESFEAMQEADLLVRYERILSVDTSRSAVLDGEVLDQSGLTLTLSQAAVLDGAEGYTCFLQLSTGLVEAIAVTQGASEYEVVLDSAPTSPLVVDDDAAYRTGYVIVKDGDDAQVATPMLVTEKDPGEGFTVKLEAVNYDARYYANDADFVATDSGTGTTPDPGENPGGGTPDPDVTTEISPPFTSTQSNAPSVSRAFTAIGTGGAAAPTSFLWGVSSGNGFVSSQSGADATLTVFVDQAGQFESAQFFCDIVVDGVTYREFCTMTHIYNGDTNYDRPFDPNSNIP